MREANKSIKRRRGERGGEVLKRIQHAALQQRQQPHKHYAANAYRYTDIISMTYTIGCRERRMLH
jgi:uncharacterized protein YacL